MQLTRKSVTKFAKSNKGFSFFRKHWSRSLTMPRELNVKSNQQSFSYYPNSEKSQQELKKHLNR